MRFTAASRDLPVRSCGLVASSDLRASPVADLWTVGTERLGYRVVSWYSRRHSHREEQQHLGVLEAGAARGSQSRQGRGTSIRRAQRKPHMTGSHSVSNGKSISTLFPAVHNHAGADY